MSTKVSIKARQSTEGRPGFHLYYDDLDEFEESGGVETPVYLSLEGVAARVETLTTGGAAVTVSLPRELARELGLLPSGSAPDSVARATV